MDYIQKVLRKELYKKSFYEFVKYFWDTFEPKKMIDGALIQFYCETFQYFCRKWVGYKPVDIIIPEHGDDVEIIDVRGSKSNLNINVPPRHTKSLIFNVCGPTWLWTIDPITAVSVSHNTALASSMNTKRAKLVHSQKFQELYGEDIHLTSQSAYALGTDEGGDLRSQARDSFTGFGADIIVNDDLTNAETARRDQAEMLSAWSYYQNTMPSRVNDINKCLVLNIQQRLAPNDITGHILDNPKLAERYTHIVLRAQFTKDTIIVCPISGTIFRFKKGDFLWPERFGDYQTLRDQVGEAVWETQYQQNPIASDKTVIKEHMLRIEDKSTVPAIEDADMIYASHDFPVKDKDTSDFLGSVLAYKVGSTLYIIDCLEKKMAYTRSVKYVTDLDAFYPGIIQVIEDKANGSPILQQLQDSVPGMQAFQPGTNSKMQRLESASLYINNIVFVATKFNQLEQKWQLTEALENLTKRLTQFPFVEHDDIVDAFSQLVLFVFMDRRYMVYGRAFNDENIVDTSKVEGAYSTIFFNKEGDVWKAVRCKIKYGTVSTLFVTEEIRYKAGAQEGLKKLKEFAPDKNVFIDCSATDALRGFHEEGVTVERYEETDFDQTVASLNLAFSRKTLLLDTKCKLVKADIENFKFSKTKDENVKYATTKDGFLACLRIALRYFGAKL